MYMAQMNLHVTPEFERALARFMRLRGLTSKSAAVRLAVSEAVGRETRRQALVQFSSWVGAANRGTPNPRPRFANEDDLWK
jgi:Arc/MetJ family transcription regulator